MQSQSDFFDKTLFDGEDDDQSENSIGPWKKVRPAFKKRVRTEASQMDRQPQLKKSQGEKSKLVRKVSQLNHYAEPSVDKSNRSLQKHLSPLKLNRYMMFKYQSKKKLIQNIETQVQRIPAFRQFNFITKRKKNQSNFVSYLQCLRSDKSVIKNRMLKKNVMIVLPKP